jgi:hypothetical protein
VLYTLTSLWPLGACLGAVWLRFSVSFVFHREKSVSKLFLMAAGAVASMVLAGSALAGDVLKPSQMEAPATEMAVVGQSGAVGVLTLTTPEGHTVTVTVDGYGAFNSALFTPLGFPQAQTTSVAHTFFSPEMQFMRRDLYGDTPVTQDSSSSAVSYFTMSGVKFRLRQVLQRISGGVSLVQSYTMVSTLKNQFKANLVRYHDVDMMHSGTPDDDVGVSFLTGAGAIDPLGSKIKRKPTLLLASSGGGRDKGWAVRRYAELNAAIVGTGEIPEAWRGIVSDDADLNGEADVNYDLAVAAAREATLVYNRAVKVTFRTNFLLHNMP